MANKFDDLLEQFGSNDKKLNETVLVDKKYLEEQKRKAKAFNEILNVDLYQHEIIVQAQVVDIVNKYMEDK
ncbi:hypothetical protein B5723_14515 [Mammaliicoccus sciuri]|uniref:hypothetical protein n=1 Tax=Mammaliicoccus sciuri TaxID=1296 RepID=UPI000A043634|nr:hypothetical protein [Mammaliicoccus sciuri]ORI00673.1 hypothetical protein B5723_14515 [Mammaliicoccus sciuri]